jgi:hypothetical protein
MFRIHDILVWIRIRIHGSMPLTNGPGFGSGSGTRALIRCLFTANSVCAHLYSVIYTVLSYTYAVFRTIYMAFFSFAKYSITYE